MILAIIIFVGLYLAVALLVSIVFGMIARRML